MDCQLEGATLGTRPHSRHAEPSKRDEPVAWEEGLGAPLHLDPVSSPDSIRPS